jgi:hypothetical protein
MVALRACLLAGLPLLLQAFILPTAPLANKRPVGVAARTITKGESVGYLERWKNGKMEEN